MAENKLLNQNKISEQIVINFCIKIIELALIIFHLCYFLGLFWYIVVDIVANEMGDNKYEMSPDEYAM